MKKKDTMLDCIGCVVTDYTQRDCEKKEKAQMEQLRKYAAAHRIRLKGFIYFRIPGAVDRNRKFAEALQQLVEHYMGAEGILLQSMMQIATDVPDAYRKVAQVHQTGGRVISIEEGELKLKLSA